MLGANFLAAQLARICWVDGRDEGLNGMLGCAFVIRNRVRKGWYNGSWAEVLSHHREWSANLEPFPDTIPNPNVYSFQNFLQEVDGVFNGTREDDVTIAQDAVSKYMRVGNPRQGDVALAVAAPVALYYGHSNNISNPWFEKNICNSPDHTVVATNGTLFFWS